VGSLEELAENGFEPSGMVEKSDGGFDREWAAQLMDAA
jgi:hypothetical protein